MPEYNTVPNIIVLLIKIAVLIATVFPISHVAALQCFTVLRSLHFTNCSFCKMLVLRQGTYLIDSYVSIVKGAESNAYPRSSSYMYYPKSSGSAE